MKPDSQFKDPFLWLENINSPESMEFVKAANETTLRHFENQPQFKTIQKEVSQILLAKDRVPFGHLIDDVIYNFWQDENHIKGILRRTSLADYQSSSPKWETVLDLDQLAKDENTNWNYQYFLPAPKKAAFALLSLSIGGKDASVIREFDLKTKKFVTQGFHIPESKSYVAWKNMDTLLIATRFSPDSLTTSGYPREIKELRRGQPLSEATFVMDTPKTDMSLSASVFQTDAKDYEIFRRQISFYDVELFWRMSSDKMIKLPTLTTKVQLLGIFKGHLFFELKESVSNYITGSVLALDLNQMANNRTEPQFQLVYEPKDHLYFEGLHVTRSKAFGLFSKKGLTQMQELQQKNDLWIWQKLNYPKTDQKIGQLSGQVSIGSTHFDSDLFLIYYTDYLTPTSQYLADAGQKKLQLKKIKSSPTRFDSSKIEVLFFEAKSADGTIVPYNVILKKGTLRNSKNPTLLYGYGGFEYSLSPNYLTVIGKTWIEKGGIYVTAHIRGGGEFGPDWHRQGLQKNRHRIFEDFAAVAQDLTDKKWTSARHLGVQGRSNGGLLTGVMLTRYPKLINAALIEVPLLDMLRYPLLLAGASWMDEYGNPQELEMKNYLESYSPYHQMSLQKDLTKSFPAPFFMTSTKDDRVHPAHARKMYALMKSQNRPAYYFENINGGHAGNASIQQSILWASLEMSYLWESLK